MSESLGYSHEDGKFRLSNHNPFLKQSSSDSLLPSLTKDFDPFKFENSSFIPRKYSEETTDRFSPRAIDETDDDYLRWSAKLAKLETKCEISYSQLEFINLLGEGAFGEVWRANLWGMDVAVKKLKGNFLRASPFVELIEEVAVLKALRHPNCVLFLGFTRVPHFCIITEYLSHGSLRSLLSNRRIRITSKHIIKFALSIARGMNYLHTQSPAILHRDLTSHNILCHDNWTIKVADYGLSTIKDTSSMNFCGAVQWRAPEVEPSVYYPESDVYSFGVILWELLTRSIPFEGRDLKQVVKSVKRGERLEIPSNSPKFLVDLIQQCWQSDPFKRPSFQQIIDLLKPFENSVNASVHVNHHFINASNPLIVDPIVNNSNHDSNSINLRNSTTEKDNIEENNNNSSDSCASLNVDSDHVIQLNESDWIFSEMITCEGNQMIGKIWTTFFSHQKKDKGIQLLTKNFLNYHSNKGYLLLVDSFGKMILIIGFDCNRSLKEFDKYYQLNLNSYYANITPTNHNNHHNNHNNHNNSHSNGVNNNHNNVNNSSVLSYEPQDTNHQYNIENNIPKFTRSDSLINYSTIKKNIKPKNNNNTHNNHNNNNHDNNNDNDSDQDNDEIKIRLFETFLHYICTPILSETHQLVTYDIKSSARFAHVIQLDINEGFGSETLDIFEKYGILGLQESFECYCGSLLLSDFHSGKVLIVILYENEEGMISLEKSGFIQQQLANISSFIHSIPIIQRFCVEENSLFSQVVNEEEIIINGKEDHEEEVNLCSPLHNNHVGDDNDIPLKDQFKKKWKLKLPRSDNQTNDTRENKDGKSKKKKIKGINKIRVKNMRRSPRIEPTSHCGETMENWPSIRYSINNDDTFIDKKKLRELFGKCQKFILLPDGKKEGILRSFFCAHQSHRETGLLHITIKSIIFESKKIMGKSKLIRMRIIDIMSMDKTKYSFLPTKGHSLEITLHNNSIYRFKGLWHRDELVNLVQSIGETYKPRHSILLLTNGAPNL